MGDPRGYRDQHDQENSSVKADQRRGFRRDDQGRTITVRDTANIAAGSILGTAQVVSPDFEADVQVISTESTTMSESSIGIELVSKPIEETWRTLDRHGRRLDEVFFTFTERCTTNAADDILDTLINYTPWSPEPTLTFSYNGKPQRICKRNYHRRLIGTLAKLACDRATEMTCLNIRQDEDDHQWWSKDGMLAAGWYFAGNMERLASMSLMSIVADSPKYMLAVKHGDLTELDIRTICELPELINAWHEVCLGIKPCIDDLLKSQNAA